MPTVTVRRAVRPALLAAALTAALAVTLSGCSSSSGGGTAGDAPSTGAGHRDAGQRQPGVSGLIAAVSGRTLEVQGATEQTAVTWTGTTTFTEVAGAKASALRTGLCATVRSAGGGASPGTTSAPATSLAATAVTLVEPVDGACAPAGFGAGRPAGTPSGAPSGGPSGRAGGGFGRGTEGKVTSVDGATFVVAAAQPGGGTTTAVTVTTSSSTTWSKLARTTGKAATVGRCATATGTTGSTGALTARTVRLSAASADGTCPSFGGYGGRGPGAGGQPGQGGQPGGSSTANG